MDPKGECTMDVTTTFQRRQANIPSSCNLLGGRSDDGVSSSTQIVQRKCGILTEKLSSAETEDKLFQIYMRRNVNELDMFLKSIGATDKVTKLLDKENSEKETPLLSACLDDDLDRVACLLKHGAKVDRVAGSDRLTPLHHYCKEGIIDGRSEESMYRMVELLLSEGANPNVISKEEPSILSYAVTFGSLMIVELLLEAGADPNHCADTSRKFCIEFLYGTSKSEPLYGTMPCTAMRGCFPIIGRKPFKTEEFPKIMELLISYSASVNNSSWSCPSPVTMAAAFGSHNLFQILKHAGANFHGSDYEFKSVLLACCTICDTDDVSIYRILEEKEKILQLVLSKDLDVFRVDSPLNTLLQSLNSYCKLHKMAAGTLEKSPVVTRVTSLLIDKGTDIHKESGPGRTALFEAVTGLWPRTAERLISLGCECRTVPSNQHNTFLHACCSVNDGTGGIAQFEDWRKIVHLLISQGVGINVKNEAKETPLVHLADQCRKYLDKQVFKREEAYARGSSEDVNVKVTYMGKVDEHQNVNTADSDEPGDKCRKYASRTEEYEQYMADCVTDELAAKMVDYLIDQGADVNVVNAKGESALYLFSCISFVKTSRTLIQAGADVNAFTDDSCRPLHACFRAPLTAWNVDQKLELAQMLFDNGAKVKEADRNEHEKDVWTLAANTVLRTTDCSEKFCRLLSILIEHGADPETGSEFHITQLLQAAHCEALEVMRLLLEAGVNVNTANCRGMAALHFCFLPGQHGINLEKREKMVDLLLQYGANVNQVMTDGPTPLQLLFQLLLKEAAKRKDESSVNVCLSMARKLLDRKADPNLQVCDLDTPLILAVTAGSIDGVKLLLLYGANVSTMGKSFDVKLMASMQTPSLSDDILRTPICALCSKDSTSSQHCSPTVLKPVQMNPDEDMELQSVVHCRFCGYTSSNLQECDRCGRMFENNVTIQILKLKKKTVGKSSNEETAGSKQSSFVQKLNEPNLMFQNDVADKPVRNHVEMLSLLVEAGGDVNTPDSNGDPPLYHALCRIREGSSHQCHHFLPLLSLLLQHGADVNISPSGSSATRCPEFSALVECIVHGSLELVELFIKAGAGVKGQSQALLHACFSTGGNFTFLDWDLATKKLELLLQHGADVNALSKGTKNCVLTTLFNTAVVEASNRAETLYRLTNRKRKLYPAFSHNGGRIPTEVILQKKISGIEDGNKGVVMKICKLLLDQGADPNAGQDPPLLAAVKFGSVKCVKMLLDGHASVHCISSKGLTVMHSCFDISGISTGSLWQGDFVESKLAVAKLLLEKGANATLTDKAGRTVLDYAIIVIAQTKKQRERVKDIVKLLLQYSAPVNTLSASCVCVERPTIRSSNGLPHLSPLMWAVKLKELEIVKMLLEVGADVNYTTRHLNALNICLSDRDKTDVSEEIVSLLIAYGAYVKGEDSSGLNYSDEDFYKKEEEHLPLQTALRNVSRKDGQCNIHDLNIVEYLLDCGATYIDEIGHQNLALELAVKSGSPSIVKCLLDAGAPVDRELFAHKTALCFCCKNFNHPVIDNRVAIVDVLIQAGADVNVRESGELTPIMMVTNCHGDSSLPYSHQTSSDKPADELPLKILKLLLKNNALPNDAPLHSDSALLNAVKSDSVGMVQCLVNYQADVDYVGLRGKRALHLSCEKLSATRLRMAETLATSGADTSAVDDCRKSPAEYVLQKLSSATPEEHRVAILYLKLFLQHGVVLSNLRPPALIDVVRYGPLEMVSLLLENGVDPNQSSSDGKNALHLLFKETSSNGIPKGKEYSPLHKAKLLLQRGTDIGHKDLESDTPLEAILNQHNKSIDVMASSVLNGVVQEYLSAGASLKRDDGKEPTLMMAVNMCNKKLVRMLLDHGADVNVGRKIHPGEIFPIQKCCHNLINTSNTENLEIAEMLIQAGARATDVDIETDMCSMTRGDSRKYIPMIELLVKNGAVLPMDTQQKSKILIDRICTNQVDLAKYLLHKGVNPDLTDNEGKTALAVCLSYSEYTMQQRLALSRLLVQGGSSLNVRAKDGTTMLGHFMIGTLCSYIKGSIFGEQTSPWDRKCEADLIHLLVSSGMNVDSENSGDERPTVTMVSSLLMIGRYSIARYLVSAGYDFEAESHSEECFLGQKKRKNFIEVSQKQKETVAPLTIQCRKVIRKHLSNCTRGANIIPRLQSIGFPPAIIDFMKMEEEHSVMTKNLLAYLDNDHDEDMVREWIREDKEDPDGSEGKDDLDCFKDDVSVISAREFMADVGMEEEEGSMSPDFCRYTSEDDDYEDSDRDDGCAVM